MDIEQAEARKLGERIRKEANYYAAPPGLAARILAALPPSLTQEPAVPGPRAGSRWNTWWAGSALTTAFALVLGAGVYLAVPGADERLAEEVIAGHVRSLMVDHAADVASSDRHAVKPWFAGKLDFSPPVIDLTAQGFTLVGGRLDYLDRRPVAALIYRHRQHLINLFVWPAAGDAGPRKLERQGFHLITWNRAGMTWWAVSDLNPQELAQFRTTLDKAAE